MKGEEKLDTAESAVSAGSVVGSITQTTLKDPQVPHSV